jgi:hypothetical protein
MNEQSWYAEASLVSKAHVFCAGSLAQCVRRWRRLAESERSRAELRLHKRPEGHLTLGRDEIAELANRPDLAKI